MDADSGTGQDEDESLLRPAWEGTEDETDADRGVLRQPSRTPGAGRTATIDDIRELLDPLCTATDALARLEARASAADDALRTGLITRLAYAEAAGFLAHTHAWAHPLDLCLRDAGLTASTALAATGAGHRTLPQTFGGVAEPRDWTDPTFELLADGDRSLAEALALARALRRLVGRTGVTLVAKPTEVMAALPELGTGALDSGRFALWWDSVVSPPPRQHRFGKRMEEGAPSLPPLLAAPWAAESWMEATIAESPTPAQALYLAAALVTRHGPTRNLFVPVWTAYPAIGFGDRTALPTLRSDAADRLLRWGQCPTWPIAWLHLVAESARAGLRELERLETAAVKGRGLAATSDKRSRLPDAIEILLRSPVLTPKALAGKLRIAPQTATSLLRDLRARGVVREVTGRGSFRAFAI